MTGNVTIHGVRLALTNRTKLIGRLEPNRVIHFSIVLNYDASAEAYAQSIYDPTSPNYHQFLTPQTFADRFGPTLIDYQSIVNWLQTHEVTVTSTAPDRLIVEATASVGILRSLFNTTFSTYQYGNRTIYTNDQDPQVPTAIGRIIRGIVGFHNLTLVTPLSVAYNPTQIRTAYDSTFLLPPNIGYTGAGKTIDILDAYDYPNLLSDLTTFDSDFSLPPPAIIVHENPAWGTYTVCPTPSGNQGSWCFETAMDTQWAHSMAPGASLHVILVPDSSDNSLLAGIQYVVNTDLASGGIFSNSWGGPELCTVFLITYQCDSSFVNNVHPFLMQATIEGITTLFSTGDSGAYNQCSAIGCSSTLTVEYPSSDPYVTAVGGTSLNSITGPSETAWSDSTGGISSYSLWNGVGEPSYQSADFTLSGRGVPDVSMDADPSTGVYVVCNQGNACPALPPGESYVGGGTSLAAPLWAGSVALIDQAINSNLGFLNPLIYQIYGTSEYNKDFHDVTSGNNGYYSAGTGWDAVTGLGTPDLFKMAQYRGMTTISVNPNPVTQTLFYSGSGFTPNTQVQVVIWNDGTGYLVGNPTSSNSGTVSGSFFVGGNIIPGTRRVTLTDSSTGYVATTTVQVIELTVTATQSTTTTTTSVTSTLTSSTSTSSTTTTATTTSTSTTVSGFTCVGTTTTTTSTSITPAVATSTTSTTSTTTTTSSRTSTYTTRTVFTSTSTSTTVTTTTTSACTLSLTSTSTTATTSTTTYTPRTIVFHTTPATFVGATTPGSISACSGTFTDGQSSLCGAFSATANLPSPSTGWQFSNWVWTGGVSCTSGSANPTSCTASDAGSLQAVFLAHITFNTNPASAGSISWDSCSNPSYLSGQTLQSDNFGVHTICANSLTNAGFAGWSCTGSISCSGLNPISTATFNGPGSIMANFGFPPINFDFRLSNSGSSSNLGGVTIGRGSSGSITITISLVNGPSRTVALSCNSQANGTPLPSGVSCSPASGTPPFGATLTITVSSSTAPGYYSIKVAGTSGSLTRTTIFTLHVT